MNKSVLPSVCPWLDSFICIVCSSTHLSISYSCHLFMHSFVNSFVNSYVNSFLCSFIPSFRSFFPLFLKCCALWNKVCRRSGLTVSALVLGSSGQGSSPGRGHCVVFLGKTLNSHSASFHPGVEMGTSKLLGRPNNLRGSDLQWTSIPSRGSRNTPSRLMLQKPG